MAETNAQRAYSLIKQRIITTRMKPGSVIDETALVADLQLGRTPIREACKRLEGEKLIVVLSRRGMYVAEVTLMDLRELQEVRLELEALCARLAVERGTQAQAHDICLILDQYVVGDNRQRDVQGGFLEVDQRLHVLMWRASQNSQLEAVCSRMYEYYLRMWYLFVDKLPAIELHEEYLDDLAAAVSTRDPQLADQAMRRHIRASGDAIRRFI